MTVVTQSSVAPTRKLTSVIVMGAIAASLEGTIAEYIPMLDDPRIYDALSLVLMMVAGWFVKDKANVQ